jgi:uncharacterized RDD family membrane protein YckC
MTLADDYINSVIQRMPGGTPLRDQIATELRGHIAERQERGQSLDDVIRQLGDPETLAESYLSSVPLVSARFMARVAAKVIDWLAVLLTMAVVTGIVWASFRRWDSFPFAFAALLISTAVLFPLYTVVAEYRSGATIGKRLFGLRVVQESGARIGLGQSIVRQLPLFFQIFVLDAIIALFTAHHQRAFELVTKTRVVRASGDGSEHHGAGRS